MNLLNCIIKKPAGIIFMFILLVIESCTCVLFDQPQPVNTKNLKKVPREIQGKWTNGGKTDYSTIEIKNTSYLKLDVSNHRIPLVKINSSGKYKIHDGRIYDLEEKNSGGYQYKIINDTVCFSERSEQFIALSDSALLRPAKDCYVLNLKKESGWEIFLIHKSIDGRIFIDYPLPEDLYRLVPHYPISVIDSTRDDTVIFHAEFKSKDIKKMIKQDGSGTLWYLRPDLTFNEGNLIEK